MSKIDELYRLHRLLDGRRTGISRATLISEHGFARVHRGELIALARVRALDGGSAILDDGDRARVSRRLAGELRRRLGLR